MNGYMLYLVIAVALVVVFLADDVVRFIVGRPTFPRSSIVFGLFWPICILVVVVVFVRIIIIRIRGARTELDIGLLKYAGL